MRQRPKSWLGLLVALGLATGVHAITQDAAVYHSIAERNVFGLRPRPEAVVPPAPQQPLRKLILIGITTVCRKRALLKAEPIPGRAGEQEESLMLGEGEREGDIEVVQIDELAERVTVNNAGTVITLSFEKNGLKTPAAGSGSPGLKLPQRR